MMAGAEQPLCFALRGETLLGVIHDGEAAQAVGVLVVVGGPQIRVGSHRQFVDSARRLAAAGFTTMRFDVRGMGDSSGAQRSFEALDEDIGAAIDALLHARPALRRVVLWGLCDGASAALLYLQRRTDPRVAGLVLLNPWVRTASTQAATTVRHYYRQRLLDRGFWLKLLSGRVAASALRGFIANWRTARHGAASAADEGDYTVRMRRAWHHFPGPILLVLSGQDYTAKEFLELAARDPGWQATLAQPKVTRLNLPEADHTFSVPGSAAQVDEATVAWLVRAIIAAPATGQARS